MSGSRSAVGQDRHAAGTAGEVPDGGVPWWYRETGLPAGGYVGSGLTLAPAHTSRPARVAGR